MSTLTTILGSDGIGSPSRVNINNNFTALNTDKIETSVIDTDTTLAANSDSRIPSQRAIKAYVDSGGNTNASTTVSGVVEEATDAEVLAGTGTGATGARLFVNPASIYTYLANIGYILSSAGTAGQTFTGATSPQAAFLGRGNTDDTKVVTSSGTDALTDSLANSRWAQKVTTTTALNFNKVIASMGGNGGGAADDFNITIEADAAGAPSGTPLYTSDTVSNVTGAQADRTFTFSVVVELAASTTYWVVFRSLNRVNNGAIQYGQNAAGTSEFATYNGSWTVDANDRARMKVQMSYTAGIIYKTDSSLTNGTIVDGFVVNSVAAGSTSTKFISVYGGFVVSGFTGLTLGSLYYANGQGSISVTDPGSTKKVGRAISTTALFALSTIT